MTECRTPEKEIKTCDKCRFWMKTHDPYEGVCTSPNSLASTVGTIEAKFTCGNWEPLIL